jgi:hypothetical protein
MFILALLALAVTGIILAGATIVILGALMGYFD